jgi:hypothetical protein
MPNYRNIPGKQRIAIIVALFAVLVSATVVDQPEHLLGSLTGGALFGLLITELVLYLKRRKSPEV